MNRVLVAMALAAAAEACVSRPRPSKCSVSSSEVGYVHSIGCEADYAALAPEDDLKKLPSDTRSINFVIDHRQHNALYFLNTGVWQLHIDFAFLVLAGNQPDEKQWDQFVAENYVNPKRRFFLGKLVQFKKNKQIVFQTWEGDQASPEMIADAFQVVRRALYNGDQLRFRPTSPVQQQRLSEIARRIPVANDRTLFAGFDYQALNPAIGVGRLRFVKAAQLEASPPLPTDIVVLDHTPPDIPVVQGIVTAEFQTPLSHINLLCRQRRTPNMALADAMENPSLRALEGQWVRLSVHGLSWQVEPVSVEVAQTWWDQRRPRARIQPRCDTRLTGIVDLTSVGAADAAAIGSKAANLAELMKLGSMVRTPRPAFALPFSAFDEHMRRHGLWSELETIIKERPLGEALEERLFQLRWRVFSAPMDGALRQALWELVRTRFAAQPLRFRSSTNVEDLAEFNGAGLYTSVGASATAGPQAMERAVKAVWASAYNYAAYVERDYYRVVERDVRMGVLIHPAFKDERVNGVALAYKTGGQHSFGLLSPSVYINAQKGDVSVTNPTGVASEEQLLWYAGNESVNGWFEVAKYSSLSPTQKLMTDAQYRDLVQALSVIHPRFASCSKDTKTKCILDVEWKLAADNQVYVKQARPLRK